MRLWLLKRTDDSSSYDIFEGFVVRAESEERARALVQKRVDGYDYPKDLWPLDEAVLCEAIDPDGPPKIILEDFKAG